MGSSRKLVLGLFFGVAAVVMAGETPVPEPTTFVLTAPRSARRRMRVILSGQSSFAMERSPKLVQGPMCSRGEDC